MMNKLNECTIVAAKLNNHHILFKNQDGSKILDHEILRMIVNNTEVAVISDSRGWAEGLSELGIGFVYSFFAKTSYLDSNFKVHKNIKDIKSDKTDIDPKYLSNKGKDFLDVIISKSIEEALEKIEKYNWNGNYLLSDGLKTYEIEIYKDQFVYRMIDLDNDIKVKTNHGILIKSAGQQDSFENIRRGDSEVRKISTKRYLLGYKDYIDIIKRMKFQEYDKTSALNVYRTDDKENTISQFLLDCFNKTIYFSHNSNINNFYGIQNELPENYNPKIKIEIINNNDFDLTNFKKLPQFLSNS